MCVLVRALGRPQTAAVLGVVSDGAEGAEATGTVEKITGNNMLRAPLRIAKRTVAAAANAANGLRGGFPLADAKEALECASERFSHNGSFPTHKNCCRPCHIVTSRCQLSLLPCPRVSFPACPLCLLSKAYASLQRTPAFLLCRKLVKQLDQTEKLVMCFKAALPAENLARQARHRPRAALRSSSFACRVISPRKNEPF
jgi:hypothetical protein